MLYIRMKARSLQALTAIALAGFWGALLAFGHLHGGVQLLGRIEATLTDLRMLARGVQVPPDLVTIVAIDDRVVREHGGYPFPRAKLAEVIDAVARHHPKAVGVDLLLVDARSPADDAALARSLNSTRAVIAAAAVFAGARQSVTTDANDILAGVPLAERFLLPQKIFADHASVGVVNLTTDATGIPRSVPMLFRTEDAVLASFPLRVATAAAGADPPIRTDSFVVSAAKLPTDIGHQLPISFYGPRGTIRTVSAGNALDGKLTDADIRDRVVVIGVTVTGAGDFFPTPFDPVMPGVEVISTAITHLLAQDAPLRNQAIRRIDAAVAVVLPMILVGLLAWRRNVVGLVAIALVVALWCTANIAAFLHGIWASAALPIAAAAPPTILFGAVQIWLGRRRAQHFASESDLLQQFQAPGLRRWLRDDPNFLLQPVRQNAAIVFIDLSRFTSLSETTESEQVRDLLKSFHALVDEVAVANGGLITGFMGDGAMILFGLPRPAANDPGNAARCCIELCDRVERWLGSLPAPIARQLGFKIGTHCGEIVASRLGGASYQHITATGDTVNVASRLMEIAARHGAEVALSDEMLRQVGDDCPLRRSGVLTGPTETQIRGRAGALNVWLWRSGE